MCHLIHPFLKKTSLGNWVGQVLRTLRKLVDSQPWHRPKDCLQWPPPLTHLPRLDSDSRELGADSREERTILYSSQTSLQGNKTICDSFGKGKERRI